MLIPAVLMCVGVTPEKLIESEGGKLRVADGNQKAVKHSDDPKAMRLKLVEAYKSNLAVKVDNEVANSEVSGAGPRDKGMQFADLRVRKEEVLGMQF